MSDNKDSKGQISDKELEKVAGGAGPSGSSSVSGSSRTGSSSFSSNSSSFSSGSSSFSSGSSSRG